MPSSKNHLFKNESDWSISPDGKCPICRGSNADLTLRATSTDRFFRGWCSACTNVYISLTAVEKIREREQTHLLAAYLRRLPSEDWNIEIGDVITLDNVESLIATVKEPDVLEQFDLTLRIACGMCPTVGLPSTFHFGSDWPLLVAKSWETALYMVQQLGQMGYFSVAANGHVDIPLKPTWKAYERLREIESSGKQSQNAFIAMSFDASRERIWTDLIEPGVIAAGFKPIRVDKYHHSNRIDDEIIAQIKRCRFLVADFTQQKAGIYFEAGLALGLGRSVVWMCEDSEFANLHFDTRQFNHIGYGVDLAKAKKALENRIVALEGQGTYLPSKTLL